MTAPKIDLAFLNYVTDEQFRQSLESDYREMTTALEQKCWKTAHVMAGSMIEALHAGRSP